MLDVNFFDELRIGLATADDIRQWSHGEVNLLAVGDERFDQVLMHLDLRTGPAGLRRHGGRGEGAGST